ncbi:MAG: Fpg/Nei family DNA glycosylase [Spirochaetia bacterium]
MPELPDVEVMRQYAEENLLQKQIETVHLPGSRVYDSAGSTIRGHLLGNSFTECTRTGKYMFLSISDGYTLVLHFGMTGDVLYYEDERPEYAKLVLDFSDNSHMAYISKRKLGKVEIVKDANTFTNQEGLGPDALGLSEEEFISLFQEKQGGIKSAFMDQSFISGIGNIYADEILYHAKIHPNTKTTDLTMDVYSEVYSIMREVLHTAIDCNAAPESFPGPYLIKRREIDKDCGLCSGTIQKTKVNQRPTYFCGKHQKEYA